MKHEKIYHFLQKVIGDEQLEIIKENDDFKVEFLMELYDSILQNRQSLL